MPDALTVPENAQVRMEGASVLENGSFSFKGDWWSTAFHDIGRYEFSWKEADKKVVPAASRRNGRTSRIPRSGRYIGWCMTSAGPSQEIGLQLNFEKNANGGYNVSGSGQNEVGRFRVVGVL